MSIEECWDEGCSVSSGPRASDLVAAADGEADEATMAHVRSCPHCAARVAQLKTMQSRLRWRLFRLGCPASDQLMDYCQGLLDPYQRAALVQHLAVCPHCSAELALLERATPLADALGFGPRARLLMPLP